MKKSINYWSFSGKSIYEAMDLAKAAGFEGIELALMDSGDLRITCLRKYSHIRSMN